MNATGLLVLVATPIGNLGDLSPRAVEALRGADVIAAEDTRRTRALLTHAGVPAGNRLRAVHGHNERARAQAIVEEVRSGLRVAYVTDAGMPGISDPGERLVRACADAGLPVEVVPGPSAALTALVMSGLPTARFAFEGFLPRKGRERDDRLEAIEREERTTILYESPHRLAATLADLAAVCGDARLVAVARELTKLNEEMWRGTLGAAAKHFATAPRGEIVIVLEPSVATEVATTDADLAQQALALVAEGLPTRVAADRLAARSGVSRRRAYDAVIAQRRAR
ncbi:MAG: 16S rRNA (cytidine(1402)-2'-O)-methyltransferase [Gaiellaceae bacterium]